MNIFRPALLVYSLATGLFSQLVAAQYPGTPPNILFVLSDDHSARHVGIYGNPDVQTPNLDRFARQGMRFTRAYVTCPQCAPSRGSIMTGRHPMNIGMARFSAPLAAEAKCYPEYMRTAGAYIALAGRPHHLDGSHNTPKFLSEYFDAKHLRTMPDRFDSVKWSHQDNQAVEQFVEFLDSRPTDKPFFLQLGFSDPHRVYTAPKVHDPAKLGLTPEYPDTPQVREDLAAYYDEVHRLDSNFGRVLDLLEKRGLADNTVVVFMGDNGAAHFRGKGMLTEAGIKVPLIIRWPGHVVPDTVSSTLVSGEDLAPTLLQAYGLPIPTDMTGVSFLPALLGQPHKPRTELYSSRLAHGLGLPWNSAHYDIGRVIVTERYKLIYNAMWQLPYTGLGFEDQPLWSDLKARHQAGTLSPLHDNLYFAPNRPMFELYDLEKDPYELENLAGRPEAKELEVRLRKQLCLWMTDERDFAPLPILEGQDAN